MRCDSWEGLFRRGGDRGTLPLPEGRRALELEWISPKEETDLEKQRYVLPSLELRVISAGLFCGTCP